MRNDARPIGEHSPASPLGGDESPRGPRESGRDRESDVMNRDRTQTQPFESDEDSPNAGASEPGDSER